MPGQATEVYAAEFERRFKNLPPDVQSRIVEAIRVGPWNRSTTIVCAGLSRFRLRVGDYRVIYRFNLNLNSLELLSVGHPSEIYR